MLRTNDNVQAYLKELDFFANKLQQRGYPWEFIQNVFRRFPWEQKRDVTNAKVAKQAGHLLPFKIPFCVGAQHLRIGRALKKHQWILGPVELRLVVCWLAHKNLF